MPSKTYAVSKYQSPGREFNSESEAPDIIVQIKMHNDILMRIISDTTMIGLNSIESLPYNLHRARELVAASGRMIFPRGPNEDKYRDETIRECSEMVATNNAAINLLSTGAPIKDVLTYAAEIDERYHGLVVCRMTIDTPPVCAMCDQAIIYTTVDEHNKSPDCYSYKCINQEIAAGWVELDEQAEIDAVFKATKVQHRFIPIAHGTFVQSWVKQAISTYNNRGGFSGMTLEEFLDKMAESKSE